MLEFWIKILGNEMFDTVKSISEFLEFQNEIQEF